MKTPRKSRPLLRVAALTAGALLSGCGSAVGGPEPLPGNPKGSHFDDNATSDVLIAGTITVSQPEMSSGAKAIYVSLRGAAGPPVAAKKLPAGPYPLAFELTTADVISMGGERPIPDQFNVKIALDGDDDPMTKENIGVVYKGAHPRGTKGLSVDLGFLPPPGNPKGSMYDGDLAEPIAEPKIKPE